MINYQKKNDWSKVHFRTLILRIGHMFDTSIERTFNRDILKYSIFF